MINVNVEYKMDDRMYEREMEVSESFYEDAMKNTDSNAREVFTSMLSKAIHLLEELETGLQMPQANIVNFVAVPDEL